MKPQGGDGHLQAKERGLEQIIPSWPSEENNPADTLIIDSYPKNCEKLHFCCFSSPACDTLLWQPKQTNTHYMQLQPSLSSSKLSSIGIG